MPGASGNGHDAAKVDPVGVHDRDGLLSLVRVGDFLAFAQLIMVVTSPGPDRAVGPEREGVVSSRYRHDVRKSSAL